jgi:hypothetical protein
MIALLVGTVLAVAALGFVLFPLFVEPRRVVPVQDPSALSPAERAGVEQAIAALREVEFDRQTGKLSESDYAVLKAKYTRAALAAMRSADALGAEGAPEAVTVGDDEVEATIREHRARLAVCPTCGPRPEADAVYCSNCGKYLFGKCGACGAPVTEVGARFCGSCGRVLAA